MSSDEGLLDALRDLLNNLYDYSHLQSSPLVAQLAPADMKDPAQRMRHVRSLVLKTLDEMKPGGVSFRSPGARAHSILNLHYVEGMTIDEVANELSTSRRTLYRELRKAEEDLAVLIGAHLPSRRMDAADDLVSQEVERIGSGIEDVDLASLFTDALEIVGRLGRQSGIGVQVSLPSETLPVLTNRVVARQALIQLLSSAILEAPPGSEVTLAGRLRGRHVEVVVTHASQPGLSPREASAPAELQSLLTHLECSLAAEREADGTQRLSFVMGRNARMRVLVVDDNENLIELFRRYLMDQDYEVVGAHDGAGAKRLIEQHPPDLVILDIMMPQNDGWEVLQWLQAHETTKPIPTIICSVLKSPDLALSLGATAFLPKPVEREQLLMALASLRPGTPRRLSAGASAGGG